MFLVGCGASAMNCMGRKVLNDTRRVSPIMLRWVCERFLCACGPFLQYSLSWPYYGEIKEHREKEWPPALLWSELLKKKKDRYVANREKG